MPDKKRLERRVASLFRGERGEAPGTYVLRPPTYGEIVKATKEALDEQRLELGRTLREWARDLREHDCHQGAWAVELAADRMLEGVQG